MRGYLAQKRYLARIRLLLALLICISTIITFGGYCHCSMGNWLNQYRFQSYIILLIAAAVAFLHRFWTYGGAALLLAVVNFLTISSAVSIVSSDSGDGYRVNLVYQWQPAWPQATLQAAARQGAGIVVAVGNRQDAEQPIFAKEGYFIPQGFGRNFIAADLPADMAGQINFPRRAHAVFSQIPYSEGTVLLIGLDLSEMSRAETVESLTRLGDFIAGGSGVPVLVIGNFNLAAWDEEFGRFLEKSQLEVKNTLLDHWSNLLMPPHFYILGHRSAGVLSQRKLPRGSNPHSPYLYELKI